MSPIMDTALAAARNSNSSPESSATANSPVRRRPHRVSRACDFCHSRSIRCRPGDSGSSSCQSCLEYDRKCTYDRPMRKRGVKSTSSRSSVSSPSPSPGLTLDGVNFAPPLGLPPSLTPAVITDLVEIFFEVVYPIFPLFHRQTLLYRISRGEHNHDRAFFGALMALCGLASARIRDGATFSTRCSKEAMGRMPSSKIFFKLGEAAIPKGPRACQSLDHLRTCALLALMSLQDGDIRHMKFFLGIYHVLIQVEGMDREANWPKGMGRIETEERRRLFWSMYTLELFSAVCFDSGIASREAHTSVAYPLEIDDEDLFDDDGAGDSPIRDSSPSKSSQSWLVGWNFTTDLYRILEHALDRQKALAQHSVHDPARSLFRPAEASNTIVLDEIKNRYIALPQPFKEIRHVTFNPSEDRYGFEAANIAATIQLVRMTLFATETSTTAERVQVVREVLQTFSDVPIGYLKAISTPLLHHLAGIGSLLGHTLRGPLLDEEYTQIRLVLLELVNLLSGLGTGSVGNYDPSQRLRAQIDKMDEAAELQKQQQVLERDTADLGITGGVVGADSVNGIPGLGPNLASGMSQLNATEGADGVSLLFSPDLMQDWSWAFDFAQAVK